ncbi:PREDICTED: allatostatin-A receptor-like [Branchiostoma belcheri]|uniref:Allatostatin-A receptor-like n=1 Tax=Branchiostoma belcheri TaxID=7741 RepID=A0A6P4ZX53_BRABE|nr:PREDICTED: allatostatin-A receptor-like [Branchiostoma belcheri]
MLWISVPTIVTYGITFIVGTFGNALVLFCTVRYKRLRAATTYYLASLAAADLIICSVCVPIRTAEYFLPQWELGMFMCKAIAFVQLSSVVCSVLTLTAISIERYYAILHPMKAKSVCTLGRTRKIMAGVWIMALILSSPILYGQTLVGYPISPDLTVYHCQPTWPSVVYHQVYIVYGALVIFLLPFIVMVYTYGRICRTLWVSNKLLDVMTQGQAGHHQPTQCRLQPPPMGLVVRVRGSTAHSSSSYRDGTVVFSNDNGSSASPWRRPKPTFMPHRRCARIVNRNLETFREQQGRKQLIKMLIVVIALFAICWVPLLLLNILKAFDAVNPYTPEVYYMGIAFQLMGYVNSCVNPLCYAFMSKNFRQVYLRAIGWPCDAFHRMSSCTSTSSGSRRTMATKMTFFSESHISPNRDPATGPRLQMESTL